MAFDNFYSNGQAGTSSTTVVVAWVESFEHGEKIISLLRTNAKPVIAYVEGGDRSHPHMVRGSGTQFPAAVWLIVIFNSVKNQIVEHTSPLPETDHTELRARVAVYALRCPAE